jgi:hypothetical protein
LLNAPLTRSPTDTRSHADRYLRDAWAVLNPSYRWVEFRDDSGAVLYTLGVDRGARAAEAEFGGSQLLDVIPIDQPIHDVDDARELGTLLAAVRVQALLPTDALAAAFGRAGYSVIIDRSDMRASSMRKAGVAAMRRMDPRASHRL